MRSIYIIFLFGFLHSTAISLSAQYVETVTVPLSDPSEQGELRLYNHNGAITVEGYNGDVVEVNIKSKGNSKKQSRKHPGLRVIPKNTIGISITEERNEIHITSPNNNKRDYHIRVPFGFSLQLSTHNDGKIEVSDVIGELEINTHHNDIVLSNIGGSVIADTHHGKIIVTMSEIYSDTPMAFSSHHGNIEVSFPEALDAILKLKSSKGDIYTDFEMTRVNQKSKDEKTGAIRTVYLGGWTKGQVGSGGPELLLSSFHGDIIVRKN